MNAEEHDDLWDLLGKAKQPAVSPYFSRNVLREVRGLKQERSGVWSWIAKHWQMAAVATCIVLLAGGTFAERKHEEQQLLVMAEKVSASPDYAVISHLDELLDSEENSLWLDSNTY